MKIRNLRSEAVEIAATGQIVAAGGVVDVDDELGASLCEQPANWAEAKSKKAPASAGGTEAVTAEGDES